MPLKEKKGRSLKARIAAGETTLGSWITIGHSSIAEILADAGFDWLCIDMEHSAITLAEAQSLIQVIGLSGLASLVRVGDNDPALIKRVMDAGATGVIVPMVNSADAARRAVSAVKYPPRGTRGVGLARASRYGFAFEDYKKWVSEESIVIVQVEHIDAVNNLEEILAVEGVDAFIVGPYDLSGSLGLPGEFDHPAVKEALGRIMPVAKKMKKTAGFHVVPPKPEMVHAKVQEGYAFIAYCVDFLLLGHMARDGMSGIRKGLK